MCVCVCVQGAERCLDVRLNDWWLCGVNKVYCIHMWRACFLPLLQLCYRVCCSEKRTLVTAHNPSSSQGESEDRRGNGPRVTQERKWLSLWTSLLFLSLLPPLGAMRLSGWMLTRTSENTCVTQYSHTNRWTAHRAKTCTSLFLPHLYSVGMEYLIEDRLTNLVK